MDEPLGHILAQETPAFIFAHPRREEYETVTYPSSTWPRGKSRPEVFTAFCYSGNTGCTVIDYYALKRTGKDVETDSDIPRRMPLHQASSINEDLSDCCPGPARFCHDLLIQPWLEGLSVSLHAMEFPNARIGGIVGQVITLWDSNEDVKAFQLCPFSGRLCCLTADGCELRVMDFIVPA